MALISLLLAATLATAPTPEQIAEAASRKHLVQLVATLRASPSPRDRALGSQLHDLQSISDPKEMAWRGEALRDAAERAPNDRLVQWLWATADEQRSGCTPSSPCPDRRMALARLEPDNAAAWMPAGMEAWQRRDNAELDFLIGEMAKASFNDELFVEAAMAWNEVYSRYPYSAATAAAWQAAVQAETGRPAQIDPETAGMITAIGMSAAVGMPAFSAFQACDRSKNPGAGPVRFEDCGRVGRLLVSNGRTAISSTMGSMLLRISGTATPADIEALRGFHWRMEQTIKLSATFQSEAAAYRANFADLESTASELRAQELLLQRAGVPLLPPDGWMPQDLAALKPAP